MHHTRSGRIGVGIGIYHQVFSFAEAWFEMQVAVVVGVVGVNLATNGSTVISVHHIKHMNFGQ